MMHFVITALCITNTVTGWTFRFLLYSFSSVTWLISHLRSISVIHQSLTNIHLTPQNISIFYVPSQLCNFPKANIFTAYLNQWVVLVHRLRGNRPPKSLQVLEVLESHHHPLKVKQVILLIDLDENQKILNFHATYVGSFIHARIICEFTKECIRERCHTIVHTVSNPLGGWGPFEHMRSPIKTIQASWEDLLQEEKGINLMRTSLEVMSLSLMLILESGKLYLAHGLMRCRTEVDISDKETNCIQISSKGIPNSIHIIDFEQYLTKTTNNRINSERAGFCGHPKTAMTARQRSKRGLLQQIHKHNDSMLAII